MVEEIAVEAKRLGIIVGIIFIVVILATGTIYWYFFLRPDRYVLKVKYVNKEPSLDGKADEVVWKEAEAMTISIKDGSAVTLKAVYTKKKVFFLATYKDSTKDHIDEVWEYDGEEWKKGRTSDEFSLFFDIGKSIAGFKEKGFAVMNRGLKPGEKIWDIGIVAKAPRERGRVWKGHKQRGDLWEMSTSLTSPFGKAHDWYFAVDPIYMRHPETFSVASAFVRHDEFTYGVPFILNDRRSSLVSPRGVEVELESGKPVFMLKSGLTLDNTPYPSRDQVVEITDYSIFKKEDKVPFIIYQPEKIWGGSVDDIDGKAFWSKGSWTVEMGRKLNTNHSDDIVFKPSKDKSVFYNFGVLVRSDGKTIRPSPPAILEFLSQGGE